MCQGCVRCFTHGLKEAKVTQLTHESHLILFYDVNKRLFLVFFCWSRILLKLLEYLLPKALSLDGSWMSWREGIFPTLLPLHEPRASLCLCPCQRHPGRVPWLIFCSSSEDLVISWDHWDPYCPALPVDSCVTLGKPSIMYRKKGLWYQIYESPWFTYSFSEALSSLNGLRWFMSMHEGGAVIVEKWSKAKRIVKKREGKAESWG